MKTNIREEKQRGKTVFVLDYRPEGGSRKRLNFKTLKEAQAAAKEKEEEAKVAGESWTGLSGLERADLIVGYARLKEKGLTLNQLLDRWEAGELRSMQERNGTIHKSLADAGEEFEAFMRSKGVSEMHYKACGRWVRKFAKGREKMLVSDVTEKHLRDFLSQYEMVTYNSNRDAARHFFGWAKEQNFSRENICTAARFPKRKIKANEKDIRIFTVDEAEKVFRFCLSRPELLTYVTLATFCGIRPTEVDRMTWNLVDWEQKLIHLKVTKTGHYRTIHLHPTAYAWLKLAHDLGSPIGADFAPTPAKKLERMRPLRDHMGWAKWPADIMRHSFGSYHVALTRNVGDTALEMGNSEGIIKNHYLAMVTPNAMKAFWAITPESLQ
jgi:integrase